MPLLHGGCSDGSGKVIFLSVCKPPWPPVAIWPFCMQVLLLLDGQPLGRTTFSGGVLRTAKPVPWALPRGSGTADVQLTLAFGAALGYGRYKGAPAIAYVGPQANGARPLFWFRLGKFPPKVPALGYGRYKGAPAIAYVDPQANGARPSAGPEPLMMLGTMPGCTHMPFSNASEHVSCFRERRMPVLLGQHRGPKAELHGKAYHALLSDDGWCCAGVLWADPVTAPLGWPICPPQVSGKARAQPSLPHPIYLVLVT